MNGYGPGSQHIYAEGEDTVGVVPEFLNINTTSEGKPDIEITIV